LGASVNIAKDTVNPGYFYVEGKGFKYHMAPVATSTGTVRLEDEKAGAMWLQVANKSMLINRKMGQRMADECMSPEQNQVAEAIKKNPPAALFEGNGR
jgi:carbon monoxide dehydrogenase subunit G